MRKIALVLLAGLAIACNRQEPTQAAAIDAPAETKRGAGEVILDAARQKNAGIETASVQPSSVSETVSATGALTVNEERTWRVGSHIEGRVVDVLANPGDRIKKGFVLAHLHSHQVHDSRSDYRRASDELARAKSAEELARRLRDRAARLFELKAGSRQEVDAAEANLREAASAVRNADTEVNRVRTHIMEYLGVPLTEGPAAHSSDIPIRSPDSGLLIERNVSAGSVVSVGQDMFRITDPNSLWMIASVAEADLQHLRVGRAVRVLVRAHPDRTFSGRILRLGESLDPTTRTLQVRVLVPNTGGLLKPEMYATAEIERSANRNALFIPEAAVQDLNGARIVFLQLAEDRFAARPVETRRGANGRLEVTSGLQAGDRVVVKGSFILKSQMLRSSLEEE